MSMIRVSDEVWAEIAARGKFGETEDMVLRRVFNITEKQAASKTAAVELGHVPDNGAEHNWKKRKATVRMTQTVTSGNKLVLAFDTGQKGEWTLPSRDEVAAIRRIRDEAVAFVRGNGGTAGQQHAAIRALTSRGYHITVRREYE